MGNRGNASGQTHRSRRDDTSDWIQASSMWWSSMMRLFVSGLTDGKPSAQHRVDAEGEVGTLWNVSVCHGYAPYGNFLRQTC